MRLFPLLGLCILASACTPKSDTAAVAAPAAPTALTEDELVAVRAVGAAFAAGMSAKDTAAVFALYADDARLLPPDSPILVGAEGHSALAGFLTAGATDFVVNPMTTYGIGDLAYQVGTASYAMGGSTHTVKYLEVLRKGTDGTWRYVADMFSGVEPPASGTN